MFRGMYTKGMAQFHAMPIGKLIASKECMPPHIQVKKVAGIFLNSTNMEAIALVECQEPVGLVTRAKFLSTLFRSHDLELQSEQLIISIADIEPLIIHESERLGVVISIALERPINNVFDDVIVVDDSDYYQGLVSLKQMVIKLQGYVLASRMLQEKLQDKSTCIEEPEGGFNEMSVFTKSSEIDL